MEKRTSSSSFFGFVAAVVFAIVAASILRDPALCFNIPEIGWLIHTLMTGKPLPPYVDTTEVYREGEMKSWTRDGDVIVSTLAKAGTTWMLYICHLIRTKGDKYEKYGSFEVNLHTPWPTFRHHPRQTWADLKEMLNNTVLDEGIKVKDLWDHEDYLFRVFKAHEAPVSRKQGQKKLSSPLAVLPVPSDLPNVKFLAMVRDTPDVLASFFPFTASHTPDFRRIWGGCPFPFSSTRQMLDLLFNPPKLLEPDRSRVLGWQFLEYARLWIEYEKEPNVLLLHYNDALKDLRLTVEKISSFLNVSLTNDQIQLIVEKASFDNMMKLTDAFNYRVWGYPSHNKGRTTAVIPGKQLRKGVKGDGKNLFSQEELKEIRGYQEEFYGEDKRLLQWVREGGVLQDPKRNE